MRPASYSLRTRVILLVLLAMIPTIGLAVYNAVHERHEASRHAQGNALNLVRVAAQEQGHLIAATQQLLLSLSQLSEVRQRQPQACHRILANLLKVHPYYSNLGAAAPDGQVYCSAVPMKQPVNAADRDWFRRAMESGDFAGGAYLVGRITGIPAITFGYPLMDPPGRVRAVVFAAVNLSWLNQLVSDIDLPPGSTVTAIDGHGTIVARHPDPEKWVGKSATNSPLTKAMLGRLGEGTAEVVGLDGVERLYAFAPFHGTHAENIYLGIGIPKDAVFADINRGFTHRLALLLLVTALALAAASIGSDRFVLRRVRALTDAARRLGQGDLAARTGLPHDTEELGQLARSFDEMAEATQKHALGIEQAQRELKRTNRALRTLSAGNQCLLRAADEEALLDEMCRTIVEASGYRMAWVGYAQDDEQKTVRPMAQAGFDGGLAALRAIKMTWSDTEYGCGLPGTAIRTGQHLVARNILTDPNFAPWREEARRRGYASGVAFPLRVRDRVIGALAIYASEPDAFDEDELNVLDESASDLAYGIEALRTRAAHEQASATIHRMAYFDALTGLPNHVQFEERLKETLRQAGEHNQPAAILLVDLDRFREVNTALGFEMGNSLLKEMGARLRGKLREEEMVARLRGDEFAILLPDADAESATQCARRLMQALDEPFVLGGVPVDMRVSIGIALFPGHGTDADQLTRKVDAAVQEAKRTGGSYALYAPEQDQDRPRRLALAADLRRAIEHDGLVLYFQPKVDIRTGGVCGAEALARWLHPQQGMISPAEFIPLAEQTGLIRSLTDWVLKAALRQSHAWRQADISVPIAVNLSARNLRDARLLEKIQGLRHTWGAGPDMLELEITESAIMEDPAGALDILTRLRQLGMPLFIDDFGTGYSSLGYLKKLPVDGMKIDKSFVLDMLTNKDSATIVRSTITLAHDLGLKVVAEGVEDQRTFSQLKVLGCDVAQGYYLGKPMPQEQFQEWLQRPPWGTRKTRQAG